MQLAILGTGPMARFAARTLDADGLLAAVIYRSAPMPGCGPLLQVTSVTALPISVTHVLDCSGHSGLSAHGPAALGSGREVLTLSLGALADADLMGRLEAAASVGGGNLIGLSGAIGGLDALRAAAVGGLTRVCYTGRKPPAGWRGSQAEAECDLKSLTKPHVHFQGTARDAALNYPKNANVAAAVAFAGLGLDKTEVQLIADPMAKGNSHQVEAEGAFGTMRFEVTGLTLPDNPKTSALAAMSAVAEVRRLAAKVRI